MRCGPPATRAARARYVGSHAPTRARPHPARRAARSAPRPLMPPPAACACVGCESALGPGGARRGVRGPDARQARRAAHADALHAAGALAGDPTLAPLPAAGFGKWLTSDPGIGRYVYTKRVIELEAPATYRTIVRFRWLDAGGDRVASSKSTSATCHQADLRPNLRPLGVQAKPGADADHARYLVPVVNRGKSAGGRVRRRRLGRRHDAARPRRSRGSSPASARWSRSRARRARPGRC